MTTLNKVETMNEVVRSRFANASAMSSPIRAMFEAGTRLKREFGAEAVCDFSIGNPDVPAPREVKDALMAIAADAEKPMAFGYTGLAGLLDAREAMAAYLSEEQGTPVHAAEVVLGAGAAGVMCSIFYACLEPGQHVLGVAPYFTNYDIWAGTFGCTYKSVLLKPDFTFDLPAMEAAMTPDTRIVLYNSPHNPTGHVHGEAEVKGLVEVVRRKSKEFGRPILLVADEPYRFLVYGGQAVPSLLPLYEYSCLVGSLAKNMSLPGERLGYMAVSASMPGKEDFVGAVCSGNQALGATSAPVVGQKLVKYCIGKNTDASVYARRREVMADVLARAGYEFNMPEGAFYFFPKAPGGDDKAFVEELMKHRILAVPGYAFGMPGYFRLSFCVNEDVISRSYEGFKKAKDAVLNK